MTCEVIRFSGFFAAIGFFACAPPPAPPTSADTASQAVLRSVIVEKERKAIEQYDDPQKLLERFPGFEVVPRTATLSDSPNWPCTTCHDGSTVVANTEVRELDEEHTDIQLAHGGGRYWCHTCHNSKDYDSLVSLKGQPINFDQPYLLCGQCHFRTQYDFFNGAHGKRVTGWNEKRVVLACPACHNPHGPQIPQRMPAPAPRVRNGLERPEHAQVHPETAWDRIVRTRRGAPEPHQAAPPVPTPDAANPDAPSPVAPTPDVQPQPHPEGHPQ